MPSTFPSTVKTVDERAVATALRWRSWPLVDHPRWSWLALVGVLIVGVMVGYLGQSWALAVAAAVGLIATLWQYFVPVRYETSTSGLRMTLLGRTRLIPWQSIRAYELRTTGVLLYPGADAAPADRLPGLFVPFPSDQDEMLLSIRQHLPHAEELG